MDLDSHATYLDEQVARIKSGYGSHDDVLPSSILDDVLPSSILDDVLPSSKFKNLTSLILMNNIEFESRWLVLNLKLLRLFEFKIRSCLDSPACGGVCQHFFKIQISFKGECCVNIAFDHPLNSFRVSGLRESVCYVNIAIELRQNLFRIQTRSFYLSSNSETNASLKSKT